MCHTHNKGYGRVTDTLMIQHTYGVLSIQCSKQTTFLQYLIPIGIWSLVLWPLLCLCGEFPSDQEPGPLIISQGVAADVDD